MSLHNTPKNHKSQPIKGEKDAIVLFWKNPGETLAVMLRRFREEYSLGLEEKITYAGRLDPMAEGIVPILVSDARFKKDMLMSRSKTYEVEILLGIGTDTGDMLGLTTSNPTQLVSARSDLAEINNALVILSKTVSLPYPNYSSRPVDGKPLFMHARAGNSVVLPIKKVSIYNLELISIKEYSLEKLFTDAIETIKKVQGDFRQEEIIEQWTSFAKATAVEVPNVQVVTIQTTVSSGTYMRALAEKLGLLLKVPALAYKIKRTAIDGIK